MFPNQGFQNQGFPNQQQPNGVNPNFPNQRVPNQGSQNNQFVPNPNNPFLQGNSNQNQNQNQMNPSSSGTLDEFTQQNQNQNQRPFNQQQQQQQQPFNPQRPTQQTPSTPATTPGAFPAQSPAFLACTRNCQTTSEYNPVCGTDQVGYPNVRRLDCANQCGRQLDPNWQSNGKVKPTNMDKSQKILISILFFSIFVETAAIQVSRQGACTSGQRVP